MKNLLFAVLVGLLVLSVAGRPISSSDDSRKRIRQDKKDKSDKEDVVELGITLITTNVAVRDRQRRFVPDLRPNDFHLFDNGVEQKISFFGSSEEPFSIVLVLDNSGSAAAYLKDEQDLAIDFVNELHPADRAAVIKFSSTVNSLLPFWTANKEKLTKAIQSTTAGGSTSLLVTLTGISDLLKQVKGRKAFILLTDGDDTNGGVSVDSVLRDFLETEAMTYVVRYRARVGFSSRMAADLNQLSDIAAAGNLLERFASVTGGILVDGKPADQKQFAHSVVEELRHQYILGYYPNAVAKSGKKNTIKIKVDRPNVNVSSRRSYVRK